MYKLINSVVLALFEMGCIYNGNIYIVSSLLNLLARSAINHGDDKCGGT